MKFFRRQNILVSIEKRPSAIPGYIQKKGKEEEGRLWAVDFVSRQREGWGEKRTCTFVSPLGAVRLGGESDWVECDVFRCRYTAGNQRG